MLRSTLTEIAASLDGAPGDDAQADEVKAWLFTSQNCVAVRLGRILGDRAARELLTEAAARTWRRVVDPDGRAQRLWSRFAVDLRPLARSRAKAMRRHVDFAPKGMLAAMFAAKHSCLEVALMCWGWSQHPLAIKADLIIPYHGAWGLLPGDKAVWGWVKLPHVAGEAVPIPPLGDFLAALVMNRLGMMVSLTTHLRGIIAETNRTQVPTVAQWQWELNNELRAVRDDIWDTPDAGERAGAMALLQTYLALEEQGRGIDADWSVIPWPAEPENMALFIYDRPEQADLFKTPHERLSAWRNRALGFTFAQALKDAPSETVRILKSGLEYLRSSMTSRSAGASFPQTAAQPPTPAALSDGPRALLEIQAQCRDWRQVLSRNGWDSDKAAAMRAPDAKAAEIALMGLIKRHRALLDECERLFGRDPSTALRRAFDYIDIYLSRGPEALEHTVGLAECLTLEVAQPGITEPYREPTFIVQLGRWAQKLAEQAQGDHVAEDLEQNHRRPSTDVNASRQATQKEAVPQLADVRFFQEITADITARAEFYRDAGMWLDENFSNEAFQRREGERWQELLRKEESGELSRDEQRFLENQRSKPEEQTERERASFLTLRRFSEATGPFRRSPPAFPTVEEAKRIVLMTWLMTDTEAEHRGLGLTDFENWRWDAGPGEHEMQSRRYASEWWLYPSEAYDAWVALARRAWARIEPTNKPALNVKHADAGPGDNRWGSQLPNDGITLAVAVQRYIVSRSTLRRAIEDGRIKSFRPADAALNSPLIVSDAAVARRYPRRP